MSCWWNLLFQIKTILKLKMEIRVRVKYVESDGESGQLPPWYAGSTAWERAGTLERSPCFPWSETEHYNFYFSLPVCILI